MMSFSFSGGVEVYGFISPTDITDQYPVIDPLYGIDGFRNVNTLSDLNSIPNLRRRAGMVVGVSGGTTYYKLNPSPWNGTIGDWSLFQTGGGSGAFTGGTVTGDTIFTTNLSATTFSATTYLNLPIDPDTYITGFTYNDNTFTINDNSGNTFNATISTVTGITINGDLIVTGDTIVDSFSATTLNVNGVNITGDTYVTGGTYYTGGTIIFDYNTGGDFPVSGLTEDLNNAIAGLAEADELTIELDVSTNKIRLKDIVAAGSGGTRTFQGDIVVDGLLNINTIGSGIPIINLGLDNTNQVVTGTTDQIVTITGGTNIEINGSYPNFGIDYTGQTTFDYLPISGGTVTGDTIFTSGLTANTLNINGVNITGDTYVTGGTYYTGGTIIFDYNTIGNFPVSGLTEDLNNAIAGLAETDELTIVLEIATNKIRLKDVVAPGSGGTRTFQGDIIIESGLTATTAFIIYTQWTLDFMDSLDLEIYAPNDVSIDSVINLVNVPTVTILVNNLPYTQTTLITSGDKINVTTDINSVIQFNITNYL
jgi:hypothetical protein